MKDRAALRLSLQYGQGDLHYFERLSPQDQVDLVAFAYADAEERKKSTRGGRGGSASSAESGGPPGVTASGRAFWGGG